MRRHNIECSVGDDDVLLRFDEAHEARKLTGRSDFEDTYTASNSGACKICCAVSDALADGVLGSRYRRFASLNMGRAFLSSQNRYLESTQR